MLAALIAVPELALSDDESRRLAVALNEVQKHYPVPVLSPGKMALATLVWTAGSIYVPKARAVQARSGGHTPPARQAPVDGPAPVVTPVHDNVVNLQDTVAAQPWFQPAG